MTTIDIPTFCKRFGVDPAHIVVTETGIWIRDLPDAEADRVIEALLASGLITIYEGEFEMEESDR